MFRRACVRLNRKPISNFLRDPADATSFADTLKYCKDQRIDMAGGLSSEFLHLQSRLIKYRVARLGDEMCHIVSHPLGSLPGFFTLIRHVLVLPVVYCASICIGRFAVSPLPLPPAEAAEQKK
ncbi:hypothetical protein STCU_04054 [Strigomonas culicis]|uniref:Uncharacterized protein n=1 Tax=Strigomonas culicis TaxID=28005 RepID=S9UI21_9TRYP|nr:hypothetical protein STCU_04054 [Strigomonas culicis]|eukprot:EPY30462.1 hypothetical protein STCU_04054 [Strigomonas culicis]